MLTGTLIFLLGLVIGSFLVWLALRSPLKAAIADGRRLQEEFQEERAERISAEARAKRVAELEAERKGLNERIDALQRETRELTAALSRSETQTEEQLKATQEKLRLRRTPREQQPTKADSLPPVPSP